MRIHADFSQPIIITPNAHQWVKSPGGEVKRMMLDRIGTEQARATSLVEFAANAAFPAHTHPLGEEVLVLSGVLTENEQHNYPTGWYMRNPHQSAHRVSSMQGCRIFVKLRQMHVTEQQSIRINTHDMQNWTMIHSRSICPLFESSDEKTFLEKLAPQQIFMESAEYGIEILIIEGALHTTSQVYPTGTWLRLPQGYCLAARATALGATVYVKTGHLQHAIALWGNETAE